MAIIHATVKPVCSESASKSKKTSPMKAPPANIALGVSVARERFKNKERHKSQRNQQNGILVARSVNWY